MEKCNFASCFMSVKLGLSYKRKNLGWRCLRIGCWGGYLGLRGRKQQGTDWNCTMRSTHRGDSASILGQYMWDFLCKKWNWKRFICQHFDIFCQYHSTNAACSLINLPPTYCDLPPTCRRRCISPPHGSTALRAKTSSSFRFRDHTQLNRPHSVGLLWMSDRLFAETSTWQHTILTRDRRSCLRRDSNP